MNYPVFDRMLYADLCKKMQWECNYSDGIDDSMLSALKNKLESTEKEIKKTIEWKQAGLEKYLFCRMDDNQLSRLFRTERKTGRKEMNNVPLILLNRLVRFIDVVIKTRIEIGFNGVRQYVAHLNCSMECYNQWYANSKSASLAIQNIDKTMENHIGSSIEYPNQYSEYLFQPNTRIRFVYDYGTPKKSIEIEKKLNGRWRINSATDTHADTNAEWTFYSINESQNFVLKKYDREESYTYKDIRIESIIVPERKVVSKSIPEYDYVVNLHAGRFFIERLRSVLMQNGGLKLSSCEEFRALADQLKKTEEKVSRMKELFPDKFPNDYFCDSIRDDLFCQIETEDLRNLFGYTPFAYFDGNGERHFYMSKEKALKVPTKMLNRLARYLTFSEYEARPSELNQKDRPYRNYDELEKEFAENLLNSDAYQNNMSGGSGLERMRKVIYTQVVPVGTTISFTYRRKYADKEDDTNTISLYYNGNDCWRVTDKGSSKIDTNRIWRANAMFQGMELRLTTLEGDQQYVFGNGTGGIRFVRGSNRRRDNTSSIANSKFTEESFRKHVMGQPFK